MNLCPQKGAGWGGSGRGGACPSPLFYVVRILRVNLTRFRGNLPRTADTDGWDDEMGIRVHRPLGLSYFSIDQWSMLIFVPQRCIKYSPWALAKPIAGPLSAFDSGAPCISGLCALFPVLKLVSFQPFVMAMNKYCVR